jgi:hypothetical protein
MFASHRASWGIGVCAPTGRAVKSAIARTMTATPAPMVDFVATRGCIPMVIMAAGMLHRTCRRPRVKRSMQTLPGHTRHQHRERAAPARVSVL